MYKTLVGLFLVVCLSGCNSALSFTAYSKGDPSTKTDAEHNYTGKQYVETRPLPKKGVDGIERFAYKSSNNPRD